MQEEIEHKTVNFAISTVKLSARTVLLKGGDSSLAAPVRQECIAGQAKRP